IWADSRWDPRWPETFGIVQANIGIEIRKQRKYEEAMPSLIEARDIFQRLSERLPHNIHTRLYLGWAEENLGETLYEWGMDEKDPPRMGEALVQLQRAESTFINVVDFRPDNPEWKGYLLSTRALIRAAKATQHQYANEYEAAARLFDEAVD